MNEMTKISHLGEAAQAFLQRAGKLLINGEWVASASGKTFDAIDPATENVICQLAAGEKEDVDRAVKAARRAFDDSAWSRMRPVERERLMLKLADLIEHNAEELAELESLDNGKLVFFARVVDVQGTVDFFRYMAGWATKIEGKTLDVSLGMPGEEFQAYTLRQPIGVVGQIVPWNFPLAMATWKLAPALAVGCTCVLKPAEQTSLTALRLGELILEAGYPAGVVNIITGFGETAGAALTSHPDVDVAVAGAANAIFFNSGQVCTAGSRLYIEHKLFDRVVEGVAKAANAMKLGPGHAADSQMGPVVSQEQMERVMGYIEKGKAEGGEAVAGGARHGNQGYFVQPTVFTGLGPDSALVREEIFGPVVVATPYKSVDEIAAEANNTSYGLAASVWTNNLSLAHRLTRRLKAGTVWVNTHNVVDPNLPFGGMKQSGIGRENGAAAIELYTELKTVVMKVA